MKKIILIAGLVLVSLVGYGQEYKKYWYFNGSYWNTDLSSDEYKLPNNFVDSLEKVTKLPDYAFQVNLIKVCGVYYYTGFMKHQNALENRLYLHIGELNPAEVGENMFCKYRVKTSINGYFFYVIQVTEKIINLKFSVRDKNIRFHNNWINNKDGYPASATEEDRKDNRVVITLKNSSI